MNLTCPRCHAEPTQPCVRPNHGRPRAPHIRRLSDTACAATIRLLWRTLPPLDQIHLLAALPIDDGRGHFVERINAARELVRRARTLLQLAYRVYGQR
jgi:hypothetical protein